MTFLNEISRMKMYKLCLRFHWSLFLRFQLTIFQHWFRKWLGTGQEATSHYLNQWWLIYLHIYKSLILMQHPWWALLIFIHSAYQKKNILPRNQPTTSYANLLAPGKLLSNFKNEIFKFMLQIDIKRISWEIDLNWTEPQKPLRASQQWFR